MNPAYCNECIWFYTRTIKGCTEYLCSYAKSHNNRIVWGRLVNIKRIKKCNKKEK